LILSLLAIISIVAAQANCPEFVQDAISVMGDECAEVARNQACYGNGEIEVIPLPGADIGEFDSRGDQISILDIESLTLSQLDEALKQWGIALLSVQANLPETLPGQNLSVLIFGDVELTNAGTAMEAFYFTSGVGDSDCNQAPNGIMIQSPEDAGTIELTINDVGVELGSTAFITAEAEGLMTFALLEGESTLTAEDESVTLSSGEFSTVELDEEGLAVGAPSEPQPIEELELPELPVSILPDEFEVEDSGTTSSVSGEHIIPRNGNWTYVAGDVTLSSGCPAQMAQAMEMGIGANSNTSFIDFGGADFDFETWYTSATMGVFQNMEFSNPAPNQYHVDATIEGMTLSYDMTIVSETEIIGENFMDFGETGFDCQITTPFTVNLDE
jgi:hypothetical protein